MHTTQKDRVLDYMHQNGSITTWEAFQNLGVSRLANVIAEIRKEYVVESITRITKNRYGDKCHFSEYRLSNEKKVNEV
nr:MAG: helix-turn-helix domain protein [Bacteriophage sp.]